MGKRKIWDKVKLTWNFDLGHLGLGTSVCLDGSFNPDAYDPKVFCSGDGKIHRIFSMEVHSYETTQRHGKMTLDIRADFNKTHSPPRAKEIVNLLELKFNDRTKGAQRPCECGARIEGPARECWTERTFTLDFVLDNGEQFCDTALNVAEGVFQALGVKDEGGWHRTNFSLTRESFVNFDGSWIAYAQWLRISHRLPVL